MTLVSAFARDEVGGGLDRPTDPLRSGVHDTGIGERDGELPQGRTDAAVELRRGQGDQATLKGRAGTLYTASATSCAPTPRTSDSSAASALPRRAVRSGRQRDATDRTRAGNQAHHDVGPRMGCRQRRHQGHPEVRGDQALHRRLVVRAERHHRVETRTAAGVVKDRVSGRCRLPS